MEAFLNFIDLNLNHINSDPPSKGNKEGVYNFKILETLLNMPLDPILRSRILYIRNLCLIEPVIFEIPVEIQTIEKSLMLASMELFEEALKTLNTNFYCEIIGSEAKTRTGATVNVGFLNCFNTENIELFEYSYNGLEYPDFKIQKLNHNELIYLFIKIKEILKNEENETLKKFKLNAYLNRVLWPENQLEFPLKCAFLLIDSEINNSTEELTKIVEQNHQIPICVNFFDNPITFKFELHVHLGIAYKNKFFYEEAYKYLLPYPLFLEKIDCLISMRKSQEAADEINKMIKRIENSYEREDRMILSGLYIKLAHLYQDPAFFDKAAEAFRNSKPFYLKGLFYFNRKQFDLSSLAFRQALEISPVCEKIRFSFACSLIEIDKLNEAEQILKDLKQENPTDENISKNLSYCYYKLQDIEKSLTSLKSIALTDPNSMSQFFILSVKNSKIENVKWAFANMSSINLIKTGVAYYSTNAEISIPELRSIIEKNRYIDRESYQDIFLGY